jgi:hypothetical protein
VGTAWPIHVVGHLAANVVRALVKFKQNTGP